MSTENIIKGIVAKRTELDSAEVNESNRAWDEIHSLEAKIKELAPRIDNILKVAVALRNNHFWPGRAAWCGYEFLTDGIDHRLGIYVEHPYLDSPSRNLTPTGYFGIKNGGGCGDNDLKINREGEIEMWNFSLRGARDRYLQCLKRAVNEFDDYERRFYEYAENPIPYSKRP